MAQYRYLLVSNTFAVARFCTYFNSTTSTPFFLSLMLGKPSTGIFFKAKVTQNTENVDAWPCTICLSRHSSKAPRFSPSRDGARENSRGGVGQNLSTEDQNLPTIYYLFSATKYSKNHFYATNICRH